MTVVICPGIHPPEFTRSFLAALGRRPQQDLVFPADRYPAYSAYHLWQFLRAEGLTRPAQEILLIGFSAGVVGAIGAATLWQGCRGTVKALIALDGWGVPLVGNFPIYRLSHDPFTHWSSSWLGGQAGFYADPPVAHLELWRAPHQARGWRMALENKPLTLERSQELPAVEQKLIYTTAACYLQQLLEYHGEI